MRCEHNRDDYRTCPHCAGSGSASVKRSVAIAKYIGIPYEEMNCFDLAKAVYKDAFDIELKNYFEGEVPNSHQVACLISSNKGDFVRVGKPQFGDLVILTVKGIECHLGIVLTDGRFLHSTKGVGSNMDRLDRWNNLIAGYFRHRELTA